MLLNRLKDSYFEVLKSQQEDYPLTYEHVIELLKNHEYYTELTIGDAMTIRSMFGLIIIDDLAKLFD